MALINDKDIVCCLGDSITAAGLWWAEAFQHISHTRDVKFYNCGASGGTSTLASEYLYEFCLSKNPSVVTVMYGVNDIERWVLEPNSPCENVEETLERAIVRYEEKMEYLIKSILEFGARVILCNPPPYDEYSDLTETNLKCDRQMKRVEDIVFRLAKKYGTPVIDFRNNMLPYVKNGEIIAHDRVHPTPKGYHFMGQIFLKELGEIDKIDVDTPFVIEDWNRERMAVEQKIKRLHFIDYVSLFRFSRRDNNGVPEVMNEVKRLYDALETKTGYYGICYENYMENKHKERELINELTRLTLAPKNR